MTNIDVILSDPVPLIDCIKEAIDDYQYDLKAGLNWRDARRHYSERILSLLKPCGHYNVVWTNESGLTTHAFGGRLVYCDDEEMALDWPPVSSQAVCRIRWDSIQSLKQAE